MFTFLYENLSFEYNFYGCIENGCYYATNEVVTL